MIIVSHGAGTAPRLHLGPAPDHALARRLFAPRELRLDVGGGGAVTTPSSSASPARVVVVASVAGHLLLVQSLSLAKLGSPVLEPDLDKNISISSEYIYYNSPTISPSEA